jgi:N-acetylneuraminic acid mutarotase
MRAEKLPDFPVARQTMQTAVVDDKLVALGGFGHDARGKAGAGSRPRAHGNAFVFDPAGPSWSPYGSELPAPRTQFGLVERKGELWVFGGLDFDEARAENAQFVHPLELLSGKAGTPLKETQVRLPRARRAFGGALYDDNYFMVGGMAENFAPVKECDVYTFESESWSTFPCPAVRISPQLAALDGKLYLAGGSMLGPEEPVPNASIEVYDPGFASWSTLLPEIPIEPRQLSMRVYRHALVLFSSQREDGTAQIALVVP